MADKFKAPSKVTVEYKSARKYRVTWTKGCKYSSQSVEWGYNGDKKGTKNPGSKDHIDIDLGFNPFPISENGKKVKGVYAKVTGKKGSKSGSDKKTLDIKLPKKLGNIKSSKSSDESDVVLFNVPAAKSDKDQPVEDIQYQRIFVKNLTKGDDKTLKKQKWTSANGLYTGAISKNGKQNVKFRHSQQTVYGMMCFRARTRNTQGVSDWVYESFPWSKTSTSKNVDTKPEKVQTDDVKQVMTGTISWSFSASDLKEIDYISVEYFVGVPNKGMSLPVNPNWNSYSTPSGTSKKRSGSLPWSLPFLLEDDQCLWWRVNAYPPSGLPPAYGTPVLTKTGNVAAPMLNNLEPISETHIIRVTATNNSQITDSKIVVVYHDSTGTSALEDKIIGFINYGESSVDIEVPDWGDAEVGVEIYAVAGVTYEEFTDDTITWYEIKRYEKSVSADFIYDMPWDSNYCIITVPDISDFDNANVRSKLNVTFLADVSDGAYAVTKKHQVGLAYRAGDKWWSGKWLKIHTKANFPQEVTAKNKVILVRNNNAVSGSNNQYTKGYVNYTLTQDPLKYMTSEHTSDAEGVSVPSAPESLAAEQVGNEPIITVTWDMAWEEASGTEISWANHKDAWYSTNGPSTYDVDNIREPKLNIADATLGETWYIRARFYKNLNSNDRIYGPYAEVNDGNGFSTASSPYVPALELSDDTIPENGYVTASWGYVSTDTTKQASAVLGELIEGQDEPKELPIEILTEQRVTIYASDMEGWTTGTEHKLVVKVRSESEQDSEWSDPEDLTIAEKPNCQITQHSFDYVDTVQNPQTYSGASVSFSGGTEDNLKEIYHLIVNIDPIESDNRYTAQTETVLTLNNRAYTIDWSNYTTTFYGGTLDVVTGELTNLYNRDESATSEVTNIEGEDIPVAPGTNTVSASTGNVSVTTADSFQRGYFLREMPITITTTGAGAEGITYYIIERVSDYQMLRPNDVVTLGPAGEVIYRESFNGESQNTITVDDLSTYLDDGASYRMRAIIFDNNTQSDEKSIPFTVDWTHQAIDYDVQPYGTATVQNGIGIITINNLTGTEAGDHIDIYRLSSDKAQLIYNGAQFGGTYVDPYPTIGKEGGYRLVFVTANGDYITAGNEIAWQDISTDYRTKFQLIDFNNTSIEFKYNINLDNSWKKKFTQTNYLGGSVQGDWDAGTNFETSISGNTFYDIEPEVYEDMRELADWDGICHLRTIDGTNICCNIEVSDSSTFNPLYHQHDISLSIQKVDNPELDGMTLAEWNSIGV